MEYRIRDLLKSPIMQGSKVMAGEKNISNKISDIMIMEAPDIEKWLKPNQLILTSFFSFQESSKQEHMDFIKKMFEMDASGLIVKIGRFVEELPLGILEGAEKYDLPIIVIHEKVQYSEIHLEVMQNLLNKKAEMLTTFQNNHQEFKNLSLKDASLLDILEALKRLIKKDVSIINAQREVVAFTAKELNKLTVKESRKLINESYMTYEYTRELIRYNGELSSQLLVKINLENNTSIYLVVKEIDRFVLMHEYMAIENACSAIQIEYAKELALSKVKQNRMNDLVDQLLNGKYQDREELLDLIHTLRLSNNKSYRIFTWVHRPDLTEGRTSFIERERLLSSHYNLVKELEVVWPPFAYRIYVNRLTFIIEDNFKSGNDFKRYLFDSLKKFNESRKNKLDLRIGMSEKCDVFEISKYAKQPLKVLQIARLQKREEFIELYEELGVYRLFLDLDGSYDMSSYIREKILKMDNDDEETLRVFLDNNQNYTQTSEILYIHPKTVKYRIDKITENYEIDFDDSSEMFQLMIELRIKEFTRI